MGRFINFTIFNKGFLTKFRNETMIVFVGDEVNVLIDLILVKFFIEVGVEVAIFVEEEIRETSFAINL